MTDAVIRSTTTDETRKALFVPGLRVALRRLQGCSYPAQGSLLGQAVEVRVPGPLADKTARGVVLRDDAPVPEARFIVRLADGHVLVVQGGKATTLAVATLVRKSKPGAGDPNAGDDEDGHETGEEEGEEDGGGEASLTAAPVLPTLADGEGAGWDVGQPPASVLSAVGYANDVVGELGAKMTVLSGATHPAAFLPLSGRLRGLWAGWVASTTEAWIALVDRRGIVAVMEPGKMPAFFQRDLTRFPLGFRRRAAPVKEVTFAGMTILIDKPFGSVHEGVGANGKPFMNVQKCDYGYFPNSRGEDREEFDGYVGADAQSPYVFITRQVHQNGFRDELKAMLGMGTHEEAREMHLAHVHPKMHGGVGRMKLADFKSALKAHVEREDLTEVFMPKTEEDDAELDMCRAVGVHCGLPSDNYQQPWPTEKTDFPNKGDDRPVSLRSSDHARLPLADMENLAATYQKLLKTTGFPNAGHTAVLHRLSRTGAARTDAEICAVRCREAYGDMCLSTPPANDRADMMRMASFGLVHPMGLEAVRAEMKAMKDEADGEGAEVDDEEKGQKFGWGWSVPGSPWWTPMAMDLRRAGAPAIPTAAAEPGSPASTPIVPKDADAAGIQGSPLVGAGTGEGEDSPAPPVNPPPAPPPGDNDEPLPATDRPGKGGSEDYPNSGADPNQLSPGQAPAPVPIGAPLPVPDRTAPAPRAAAHVAPSEDPNDRGPLSIDFRRSSSGSTMRHAHLDQIVRFAAAFSLATLGNAPVDLAQREALVAILRSPPGGAGAGAVAGVPGGPAAAPGAPGRPAPAAAVPRALTDKRHLYANVTVTKGAVGSPEAGTYLFIASTAAIDSYGESVEQTWDFSRFEKNPVILFAHNSHDLPIGRAVSWEVQGGKLLIRILFSKKNPMAILVQEMIDEDMIRAGSVGFMPGEITTETISGERHTVLKNNLLHEYSICAVPANPEALYIDEKALEALEGRLTRAFEEMFRAKGLPSMDLRALLAAHQGVTREVSMDTCKACKGDGQCTQCSGAGCTVCTAATGRCTICAGLGKVPMEKPVGPGPLPPGGEPFPFDKMAVPYKAYPPSDTDSWDAAAADKRCRKFCSSDKSGAADKMDWKLYNSLFGHVDDDKKEEFGGHKLLHHDIVGDKIVTSKAGVMAAGNAIQGGRGGVTLPENEEKAVKSHLAKHYKQFDLTAPWERDEGEKKNHRVPTPSTTGVRFMADQKIHRTDNPAANLAFRQRGQITLACDCGVEHVVELQQFQKALQGAELAKSDAERASAEVQGKLDNSARELVTAKAERDKAVTDLTRAQLTELTGPEIYQLSPHEADSLAQLRAKDVALYETQLAAAKSRFERGLAHAKSHEEALRAAGEAAKAGAQGAAQNKNKDGIPAPVTRQPDPNPLLNPDHPSFVQPGGPAAGEPAKEDNAALAFQRINERAFGAPPQ